MIVLGKDGKQERTKRMPWWNGGNDNESTSRKLKSGVSYPVEANNPENEDHVWGDGEMSASEMEALTDWYAAAGDQNLTRKDLANHERVARTFKWNSRARREILQSIENYKEKYKP